MDPLSGRPISLLLLVSKIFEKVVHDQTEDYLAQNINLIRELSLSFFTGSSPGMLLKTSKSVLCYRPKYTT